MRRASVFRNPSWSSLSLLHFLLALMTVAASKNSQRRVGDFSTLLHIEHGINADSLIFPRVNFPLNKLPFTWERSLGSKSREGQELSLLKLQNYKGQI